MALALLAVVVLGVVVASVVLTAGDGDDVVASDRPSTDTSAPSTTPTTAASTTSTTRGPLGSGQPITIAFAGDVNFEGTTADRLAADPASILGPVAPILSSADIAVVNMETAIGTTGTAAPKEFTFQAPAAALEAFRVAGVDVVSAANNHGMDFGLPSLEETLQAERDTGFPIIGIGAEENEAFAPFVAEVRGQRVAVIAATQVLDDTLIDEWTAGPGKPGLASAKRVERLVQAVTEARAIADTVVVFLHWGIERNTCPSADQESLAQTLVDAGADIVVGGHAHRLQGGGRLGDAVVHYGLGNFAFHAGTAEAARTGVFTVTVTGQRVDSYEWHPARISDRQPRPLEGADRDEALASWNSLRDCTNLTP